ncbi:MAG: glycosyltransferase family 39 protein, partial [Verrucomicrobia bacterium]|nr:glycosyltransferase family 39 protein [Verrucomicrobiota bacterium]
RHLLNALVGLLGVIGVWKLARLLAGSKAGLLAALLLFITPSYFGHMFNNPKDIPFAVGYVWSVYYLLLATEHFPKLPVRLILKFGLALGLTLGVRIGGVLLIAYTVMTAGLCFLFPRLFNVEGGWHILPLLRRALWLAASLAGVFVIAYAIMLLCWPWAQEAPLKNPLAALDRMSKFTDWPGTNLLAGEYVDAAELPKSYLFQYLAVKLPPILLSGLAASVLLGFLHLVRLRFRKRGLHTVQYGLLIFSIVFPVVYAILKKSILYDEVRHFLFTVPLLCVVCAAAFVAIYEKLRPGLLRIALTGACVIMLATQVYALVILHPDQYVYYNTFAGGTGGAEGRYETDYWANSYHEAVDWIAAYARARDGDVFAERQYTIFVDGPYLSATYYFPENFSRTEDRENADFQMTHTRWDLDERLTGKKIGAITRMGAELTLMTERSTP